MKKGNRPGSNGITICAFARPYLTTDDGRGVFGKGKGELLAAVEKLGSLRNAAAVLGRSYRQAWGDLNTAEKHLGFPLVERSRGGPGGGAMLLTERGKLFLRAWELHSKQLTAAVEKSFTKNLKPVIHQTEEPKNG